MMFRKSLFAIMGLALTSIGLASNPVVEGEVLVKFKTTPTGRSLMSAPIVGHVRAEARSTRVLQVGTPSGVSASELKAYYASRPDVEFVEFNHRKQRFWVPNDPRYNEQWALPRVKAPEGWDIHQGSNTVIVAVIDDGVTPTHPDLSAKLVPGRDISDNDNDTTPSPGSEHGTHCAGIAGAATNNGVGIAGIGAQVRIMPIKIWPNATDFTSAMAIQYAADNGAKVISMSYGSSNVSLSEQSAVNYAWGKGCVLVGAAGNNGSTARFYPGAYENVVAVASSEPNDSRSSFSNYNDANDPWVDVAAPGSSILSTIPSGYGYKSGTSMATPLVAGAVGLLFSAAPSGTTNVQIRQALELTTDSVGTYVRTGRLNVQAALASLTPTPSVPTASTVTTGTVIGGNTASLAAIDANTLRTNSIQTSLGTVAEIEVTIPVQGSTTGLTAVNLQVANSGPRGGSLQVWLLNPTTNTWVYQRAIATLPGSIVDGTVALDRNLATYLSNGNVRARIRSTLPRRKGSPVNYTLTLDRVLLTTQ